MVLLSLLPTPILTLTSGPGLSPGVGRGEAQIGLKEPGPWAAPPL